MIKQCVILAGGLGTRLSRVNQKTPKALTKILGEPILENQIKKIAEANIDEVILLVGHMSEKIQEHFGNGSDYGLSIKYVVEESQLGTAGALINALPELDEKFLVIYGDIFFDFSINDFYNFHYNNSSEVSLVIHPNDHPFDSDLVLIGDNNKVLDILASPHPEELYYRNLVNAAAYIFNKSALEQESVYKSDIAKDLIPKLLNNGVDIYGYNTIEYLKDMGTPERLKKLVDEIKSKKVLRRTRDFKKRAIFLDRDGVINYDVGHLKNLQDFKLIDGAAEGIRIFNEMGYLVIVVTNQPVIARGELSFEGLKEIHNKMETLLGKKHAFIDDLFFCPHHPDSGYEGEVQSLKIQCKCRKPNTGMIDEAITKYKIDIKNSWLIGDHHRDIQAGNSSGLNTILVNAQPYKEENLYNESNFQFHNLLSCAKFISDI